MSRTGKPIVITSSKAKLGVLEANWQNTFFGFVLIEVFQRTFPTHTKDVNLLLFSDFQVSSQDKNSIYVNVLM